MIKKYSYIRKKLLKTVIHAYQNIFQKNITQLTSLDSDILCLTFLDLMKLIWKDFQEKRDYNYYVSKNTTIMGFSRIKKLIYFFFNLFIILPIATFRGNLISIPIDLCINKTAFSYGNQGWNWNKDLTVEVMSQPYIPIEETRYFRFFKHIECDSYTKFMTFHDVSLMESLPKIPYGSFPWGQFDKEIFTDPGKFYNENDDSNGLIESRKGNNDIRKNFDRTVALLKSVKLNGNRYSLSEYQFPIVVILKNRLGKVRFVHVDGAHRLAVLSAFEHDRLIVRLDANRYPPILEEDIEKWPYVKSSLISRTDALKLFQLYFTLNGSERANYMFAQGNAKYFTRPDHDSI